MPLHTNQAAQEEHEPGAGCLHAAGEGNSVTCRYLRALAALHEGIRRAELAYERELPDRRIVGELWLLLAEVSSALDECPSMAQITSRPAQSPSA